MNRSKKCRKDTLVLKVLIQTVDMRTVKLTNDRLAVSVNTLEEMRVFIKDIHGIQNESFILDLVKSRWGFSKTLIFISRFKAKVAA